MKPAFVYGLLCIGSSEAFVCVQRMLPDGPQVTISDQIPRPHMEMIDCAYPLKNAERLGVPVCTL
jgi:hypothetical protein